MHRRLPAAGLAATLLALLLPLGTGAALAAPSAPPVTAPDAVTISEGTFPDDAVDVLANDTDPDGGVLAVCRLGPVPDGLFATVEKRSERPGRAARRDRLVVVAERAGTYTLTYYACDFDTLVPGTLTVTVTPAPQVRVRVTKTEQPGRLRITNRSGFPVQFLWGTANDDDARPDGAVTVGRRAQTITVRRTSIVWVAASRRTSDVKFGIVRGIRLAPGTRVLPPGAPREESGPALRQAAPVASWLAG